MNLKIREFQVSIENFVENSDLPQEIKRMILKEIYEATAKKADGEILAEINARDKEEKDE